MTTDTPLLEEIADRLAEAREQYVNDHFREEFDARTEDIAREIREELGEDFDTNHAEQTVTEWAAERGQGLAEYALIVSLVAVVCIGVLAILGTQIAAALQNIANQL